VRSDVRIRVIYRFITTFSHGFVNGQAVDELTPFRNVIGFVPQEDIMLRELSVEEIVKHSALMVRIVPLFLQRPGL
jgi:ABC-type multidrug transport system ATPase subunit